MVRLTQELRPTFQQELSPFDKRLQAIEQHNANLQQQLEDRDRQAQRSQLREQYTAQTNAALSNVMFKDAQVEDPIAQATFSKAVTLMAMADKSSPEEAARKLRRSMLAWSKGFHQHHNKPVVEKLQAGAGVPRPSPESSTRSEGETKAPSMAELGQSVTADGRRFKDILKWRMAGSPTLFKG
jgi:hypothetical protein